MTPWQQVYDPLGNMYLSTVLAALPVAVILVGLGFFHLKAHVAAGVGLATALLIALLAYGMPEGDILRYVFFHSIALACLVGLLVILQAYVWPFTALVVR